MDYTNEPSQSDNEVPVSDDRTAVTSAGFDPAEIPVWPRTALQMTFGGRRPGSCAAQLIGLEMVGAVQ